MGEQKEDHGLPKEEVLKTFRAIVEALKASKNETFPLKDVDVDNLTLDILERFRETHKLYEQLGFHSSDDWFFASGEEIKRRVIALAPEIAEQLYNEAQKLSVQDQGRKFSVAADEELAAALSNRITPVFGYLQLRQMNMLKK